MHRTIQDLEYQKNNIEKNNGKCSRNNTLSIDKQIELIETTL